MNPKITVLMPVYNGEKYLKESINSILKQSYKDFEFLIINDASTDNSKKIIKSFDDKRINLVNNEINLGLVGTLNKGITLSKGEYIVRMDQDDISLQERFKIQLKFMESHQEIGVCGSWVKNIGTHYGYINKKDSNPDKLKTTLLFHIPLAHPTVIIRKKILDKYNLKYDKNFEYSEDYDLWSRISEYSKISNIKKVLLLYRMHETNMSNVYNDKQKKKAEIIRIRHLNKLQIQPTEEDLIIHHSFKKPENFSINEFLNKKEKWLVKLIKQNNNSKYCKEPYFSKVIKKQWLVTCYANSNQGFKVWKKYWQSDLSKNYKNFSLKVKFFLKCLINLI